MVELGSLTVLGCGKMGTALISGWLQQGLNPRHISVIEPHPSKWLLSQGVRVNHEPKGWQPEFCLVAVKPQMLHEALPQIQHYGNSNSVILSVVAGSKIKLFEELLGAKTPIIRAMPNTPSAIGKGVSALVRNPYVSENQFDTACKMLSTVGEIVTLKEENQLDAVTGLSGSGPAYVFYLIECLMKAAIREGLSPQVSESLVINTIIGSGELAKAATETPEQLRTNVTSPQGTTEAGLVHLMDKHSGLEPLVMKTIHAAVQRSKQIGEGNG